MVDKINPKYLDAFTKASRQSSPATGDVLLLQRGNTNQHVLFQDLKAAIVDDPATTDGSIQELVESTTDGVSTTFSFVDTTPTSANNVFAFVDGRLDRTVTVDGKNVTFDSAPPSGEALVLIHWQTAGGGGGGGGVTDHGDLTGLSDDDHTQYALTDGTRPFTGNLDVGGNSITNVVQVDGRNLETDGTKLDTIDESADVNPTAVSGAEITAGTGTTIRGYTPANIVSFISTHASGGGDMLAATYDPGGTADDVFDMANMSEATNQKIMTAAERAKLSDIETEATADQSDSEIETAYNNRVAVASQAEMEAGTSTSVRRMTPQRVYQAIDEFTYLTAEIDALTWAANDIVSGTFADALIAETNVTQHEAAIDHDALSGFVANEHIDWTSTTENLSTSGTAATGDLTVTGNIAVSGTVDGRDVASDGTKLDGIEASADVTDTANVTAAGALMDSEVTNLADVKAFDTTDYATAAQGALADSAQQPPSEGAFVDGDKTKLDSISSGATAVETAVATVAAMSALTGASYPADTVITVDGYAADDDGGGGTFIARNSGDTVDGGLVFAHDSGGSMRWHRIWDKSGPVSVRWFGATGDGVTDDIDAITAAIGTGEGHISFPPGTYLVSTPIIPAEYQTLSGSNGWEETTIEGDSVTGGIIQGNVNYAADEKEMITVENLRITGTCDYGIYMPHCKKVKLHRLRLAFGTYPTYDCLHVGRSWNVHVSGIHVYTGSAGGRAALWFDADCHALLVEDVETTAKTQYGIVSAVEDYGAGGISSNQVFNQITLQRHEIGLYLKRCRGVTVNGLYTEVTSIPLRLGSADAAADKAVGVVINGGGEHGLTSLDEDWGYNTTAAFELIQCHGVTINGFEFGSSGTGSWMAVYLKDAKAVSLVNCIGHNVTPRDWTDYIVTAPDAERDNAIRVVGNGTDGDEDVLPNKIDATTRNSHAKTYLDGGVLTTDEWTPLQSLPDPNFCCSLSRYITADPAAGTLVARLRRSSDDDEQDFYLDSGALKRSDNDDALATWAGGDTIYGVRWYNQADTSVYMVQTDTAEQPILTTSGIDSKASWTFDGSTGRHFEIPDGWLRPYKHTVFVVAENDGFEVHENVIGSDSGQTRFEVLADGGRWDVALGTSAVNGPDVTTNNPAVIETWGDDVENGSSTYDNIRRVNKANEVTSAMSSNNTNNTTGALLGTDPSNLTYYAHSGEIAEFASWLYSISEANRDIVVQAAMDQYSIT